MKVLDDVCLLAADTGRARAYVDVAARAGLAFGSAILVGDGNAPSASSRPAETPRFDNTTPLADALRRLNVPIDDLTGAGLNAPAVVQTLAARRRRTVIVAGPSGTIVSAQVLATGEQFLHAHPGRLPDYRGSTTPYYSLLAEGRIFVSVIALTPEIDEGPVLACHEFAPPADRTELDLAFDPWIRAEAMTRVLATPGGPGEPVAAPTAGSAMYYIIHPVLKHLAIMAGGNDRAAAREHGGQEQDS